ncbi:MAG: hypothetical protein GEV03_21775 [Streptosporangiales bacterium]|nr:hypothetical protein [Streptosporangiales bacterium]
MGINSLVSGLASSRRERWASRENARRHRRYETALATWEADDAELTAMIATVGDDRTISPSVLPPLDLRRGEDVLWTSTGVSLVQLPGSVPLPEPAHRAFALPATRPKPRTPSAAVADHGNVFVTTRRVVFRGGRLNREFAYPKLVGLAHDTTSTCTYLNVNNRKKTSGLSLDPGQVAYFRFYLTLALADWAGERDGFVAHLARLRADHQRFRSTVPAAAYPADAPGSLDLVARLYFGSPGRPPALRAAQGAGMIAVTGLLGLLILAFVVSLLAPAEPVAAPLTPSRSPPTSASPGNTGPSAAAPAATPSRPASQSPTRSLRAQRSPVADPIRAAAKETKGSADSTKRGPRASRHGIKDQCEDRTVNPSGERQGSCSHNGGNRRPVYGGR